MSILPAQARFSSLKRHTGSATAAGPLPPTATAKKVCEAELPAFSMRGLFQEDSDYAGKIVLVRVVNHEPPLLFPLGDPHRGV